MPDIKVKAIKLVPIDEIKENPKNRQKHPPEQIERLKKLIEAHGFRSPLIVSKRSGLLVAGHGRLTAAKALGLRTIPITLQDFDSDEEEYQVAISDNAIQTWAELDLAGINADIGDLGPDFDLELLGLKDFLLEPAEFENIPPKDGPRDKDTEMLTCPNCGVVIEKNG